MRGRSDAPPFSHGSDIHLGDTARVETSGGIQASLGGRYASALFGLARDERQIDAVAASLATLKATLKDSSDFRRLIASPLIGRDEAGRTVAALAPVMGLDPVTTRFLGVLARNGRLGALSAIIRDFSALAARHRGQTTAEVTSAHPLTDDQVQALRDRLKGETGRDVTIDLTVDPAILGGLIVRLGSRQIDGSIRTKLNTLAHAMKG